MVIIVNKFEETIVVSVNQETLICKFEEKLFNILQTIANEELPKCTTMAEAKELENKVIGLVAQQGNFADQNFVETAAKDHLVYDSARGTYHLKLKDGNVVGKIPLPISLVDRILVSVEKGIDPLPIVKSVIRLFRNPKLDKLKLKLFSKYINYTLTDTELQDKLIGEGYTVEKAGQMAKYLQTPITTEGLLCTYKVSREITQKWALDENGNKVQVDRYAKSIDELSGEITSSTPKFVEERIFEPAMQGRRGDAFVSEKLDGSERILDHIYKVGAVQYLEKWDQVNCTDNIACVKGLHLGNLDYVRSYESDNTVTHNCFVDPMHIGAFTNNGDGAMRVKQLFIHSSKAGDNRGIYFSSSYAAHVDSEWEQMKKEAIENSEKTLKELTTATSEDMEFLENL